MLAWLEAMTHPDGGPAYFNDTSHGVAPMRDDLVTYAVRLGFPAPASVSGPVTDLISSGYVRLGQDVDRVAWTVFFDATPVAAPYLMGHGHADTLSVEVSIAGRRIIVNGGVSTYEPSITRAQERSTAPSRWTAKIRPRFGALSAAVGQPVSRHAEQGSRMEWRWQRPNMMAIKR